MTKFKAFDLRFGINLIIGQRSQNPAGAEGSGTRSSRVNHSSQSFLGSEVKVKGQEGIYSLIKKQKRRKVKNYSPGGTTIPNEMDKPKEIYN